MSPIWPADELHPSTVGDCEMGCAALSAPFVGCPVHDPESRPGERRRWRHFDAAYVATDDEAAEINIALMAQLEDAFNPDDVQPWETYEGDEYYDPEFLYALRQDVLCQVLRDVCWLASCAFRLATGRGDVAWLSFDWDADLVRSDLGTMRVSDFREYYTSGAIG